MILSQISYLDCIVFLIFLVPQLLLRVNILELFACAFKALPFFCEKWPSFYICFLSEADWEGSRSPSIWVHH